VLCAAFWVSSALFFFLIRPPPSSTLFPYTTLFRSLRVQSTDEMRVITAALHRRFDPEFINRIDRILNFQRIGAEHLQDLLDIERSEEHTSALQSRENLVCRLLLEKKKLRCLSDLFG